MIPSPSRSLVRFPLLALILLLNPFLGVSHAAAVNAKQQAVKDLKAASKSALKSFKNTVKAHRLEVEAKLAAIDDKIDLGIATKQTATEIFHVLDTFQVDLVGDVDAVESQFTLAKGVILGQLESAGFTAFSDVPKDFFLGQPGVCESFRSSVRKAIDDAYAALETRVRKLADRFEKELGIAIAFRLNPSETFEESVYGGGFSSSPLTIDLVVAGSDRSATNDGFVFLSGRGNSADGPLNIGIAVKGSVDSLASQVSIGVDGRFSFSQPNLKEGDRMYMVRHPTKFGGQAHASITVP